MPGMGNYKKKAKGQRGFKMTTPLLNKNTKKEMTTEQLKANKINPNLNPNTKYFINEKTGKITTVTTEKKSPTTMSSKSWEKNEEMNKGTGTGYTPPAYEYGNK